MCLELDLSRKNTLRESKCMKSHFKDALMGDYEMFVRIGMNVCQDMCECLLE